MFLASLFPLEQYNELQKNCNEKNEVMRCKK